MESEDEEEGRGPRSVGQWFTGGEDRTKKATRHGHDHEYSDTDHQQQSTGGEDQTTGPTGAGEVREGGPPSSEDRVNMISPGPPGSKPSRAPKADGDKANTGDGDCDLQKDRKGESSQLLHRKTIRSDVDG